MHNERMETMNFTRIVRTAALAVTLAGLAASAPMHASAEINHTQYLTFTQPVALPGVALRPGTYVFEMPSPEASPDVVRVMSRDRKTVYFSAFTRSVERPSEVPMTRLVTTREIAGNQPAAIAVWWSDARTGRQFIYE
jgi:hypothetical protein